MVGEVIVSSLARFNPQGLWTRPIFTINGWSQEPEGACLVVDGEVARLLTAHHSCEVQHLARERRKGEGGGHEGDFLVTQNPSCLVTSLLGICSMHMPVRVRVRGLGLFSSLQGRAS